MRINLLIAIAVVVSSLGNENADAAPVTFEFGGTITEIIDATNVLAGDVIVGDSFWGTYTFDSTLTDSYPGPDVGHYSSPTSVMRVFIGMFELESGMQNLIEVNNYSGLDNLSLGASNFTSAGLLVSGMVAIFGDRSATVFSSDALPLSLPPLGAFDRTLFQIEGHRGENDPIGFSVTGVITIPEPNALALLLLGTGIITRWCMGVGNGIRNRETT